MRAPVIVVVAVVALLVVVGVLYALRGPGPSAPPEVSASAGAPAGASALPSPAGPPGPGQTPDSATAPSAFPLSFERLLAGILALEQSPHPVTREQAVQILPALEGKALSFKQGVWLTGKAAEVLTKEQKDFLVEKSGGFRPALPSEKASLVQDLARVAGGEAADELPVPEDLPEVTYDDKPEAQSMDLLITQFGKLQGDEKVALSQAQARQLLPICAAYAATPTCIEEVLGAILTPEQKEYIEENVPRGARIGPDIEAKVQQVRALVEARSKS